MRTDVIPDALWPRLTQFIAEHLGLHFPVERRADLQRGLEGAAIEMGFKGAAPCVDWILTASPTPAQLNLLASHLTIGETYFLREPKTLDALAEHVLPELIRRRRGHDQYLRLWSAACCTGEEPYSLAILLRQLLPDWPDWRVTILGTDINERFLHKAAEGVYGEWSFRESPPGYKERYFSRSGKGRYSVLPEIKRCVDFAHLNLAQDTFPALATGTTAMDVILCRNVLIYFAPAQARLLADKLRRSLVDEGWLAVGPSECSQTLFSRFATVNFPGAILYRKSAVASELPSQLPEQHPHETLPAWTAPLSVQVPAATAPPMPSAPPVAKQDFAATTRTLANQGDLKGALEWSTRWLDADKLDTRAHYLHAMILQELGERARAVAALKRTVYLDPDFALAHFALGNLARGEARADEANKHFTNTVHALRERAVDEPLPESDGMTAGRLKEIIAAFIAMPQRASSVAEGLHQ